MGNIVNLADFKQKKSEKREELEKRALEKYEIRKVDDNSYFFPEISYITSSEELEEFIDDLSESIDKILESNVIEAINEIVDEQGQEIEVMVMESIVEDEDLTAFLITNKSNDEEFILMVNFNDNDENRETLTGLIAACIYEANVTVTYIRKLNYQEFTRFMKMGY